MALYMYHISLSRIVAFVHFSVKENLKLNENRNNSKLLVLDWFHLFVYPYLRSVLTSKTNIQIGLN